VTAANYYLNFCDNFVHFLLDNCDFVQCRVSVFLQLCSQCPHWFQLQEQWSHFSNTLNPVTNNARCTDTKYNGGQQIRSSNKLCTIHTVKPVCNTTTSSVYTKQRLQIIQNANLIWLSSSNSHHKDTVIALGLHYCCKI